MAKHITFRIDEESEKILDFICSHKHLTRSEAIRYLLRNSDFNIEEERLKKIEEKHKEFIDICRELFTQNEIILKSIQSLKIDNQNFTQKNMIDKNFENELKIVGELIRNAQSVELLRSVKNEAPKFYEKFVKL